MKLFIQNKLKYVKCLNICTGEKKKTGKDFSQATKGTKDTEDFSEQEH